MPTAPGTAPPRRQCNKLALKAKNSALEGFECFDRTHSMQTQNPSMPPQFLHFWLRLGRTQRPLKTFLWQNSVNSSKQPHRSPNRVNPNGFQHRMQGRGWTTHRSTDNGLKGCIVLKCRSYKKNKPQKLSIASPHNIRNQFAFANLHASCTTERENQRPNVYCTQLRRFQKTSNENGSDCGLRF